METKLWLPKWLLIATTNPPRAILPMKTNLRRVTAQCRAHAARAHHEAIAAHCGALQTINPKLYLINVGPVWFAYHSTASRLTVQDNWKVVYPEQVFGITEAPESDVDGNPFRTEWGWTYIKTNKGFEPYGLGRQP